MAGAVENTADAGDSNGWVAGVLYTPPGCPVGLWSFVPDSAGCPVIVW